MSLSTKCINSIRRMFCNAFLNNNGNAFHYRKCLGGLITFWNVFHDRIDAFRILFAIVYP